MSDGVTLELGCGLCAKGQSFSKKIIQGQDSDDGKGAVV